MQAIKDYWPIAAAILAGGMWLGALSARVDQLERKDRYEHGVYELPKGAQ